MDKMKKLDTLCERVKREYEKYRRDCLRSWTKPDLWNKSGIMHFYSCVSDYFTYVEWLPDQIITMLLEEPAPIAAMWDTYVKSDSLSYMRQEEIEALFMDMLYYRQVCLAA